MATARTARAALVAAALLGCGCFGIGIGIGVAGAQSLPGRVDPGRVEQRFERPPSPQSTLEVTFPPPDQAPPPEQAGAVRFVLHGIRVEGATVYDAADLEPLWRDRLGGKVSLTDIYALRDALTARYRSDGYVLSQVIVPAQRIRDGVVRLQAIEGYIRAVRFEGAAFADRFGLFDRYAAKIEASRPLDIAVLERYVLLADDLPGAVVRTVLRPAEGVPGAADLIVTLEREPLSGALSVDNRGTRAIGVVQVDGMVVADDALGTFDRTALRTIVAQEVRELRYLDLSHLETLDSEGTVLALGVRRSWSKPGDAVRDFAIANNFLAFRVGLSHPFVRRRSETLRGELSFTVRNSTTTTFDAPLSEDRLRTLAATATYDVADGWGGSNLVQAQIHQGLDLFGASGRGDANLSRAGGRADFTRLLLFAERAQPLDESLTLVLAAEGQYAPHELLASEEYGAGGRLFGRAFDASEITGDRGAAARAEMQYRLPPWQDGLAVQLYGFADYGTVWNLEEGPRHGRRSLASAGAGLRLVLAERIDAGLELAFPFLTSPGATGDRDPRVFFTVAGRF